MCEREREDCEREKEGKDRARKWERWKEKIRLCMRTKSREFMKEKMSESNGESEYLKEREWVKERVNKKMSIEREKGSMSKKERYWVKEH